ncbi:MAG: prolyl oligopeptidase family serine peptidase [Planctomycetota bacterium]|nr:prolyl oligopeptidase family serine peptidase [Planctomycetota bacterium]
MVLLCCSETWPGRVFAVIVLLILLFPLSLVLRWKLRSLFSCLRLLPWILLGLSLILFVGLHLNSPAGRGSEPGSSNVFLKEGTAYPRRALTNLVPEIDQIKWGTYVVPYLDPIIDSEQGERLRGLTMDLYRPMQDDPAWRELGSALPWAYDELLGGTADSGHAYVYVPATPVRGPRPAILFLHGSAGNFKAYLYLWKELADRAGYAIVAPTFGWGNWSRPGGVEVIARARNWIDAQPELDGSRVLLAGLSNGGRGVCVEARRQAGAYAGFVFISAVRDGEAFEALCRSGAWKDRRVLVLHGELDRRIPYEYALAGVKGLEEAGAAVRVKTYADEDHFLFFSKRNELLDEVEAWANAPTAP